MSSRIDDLAQTLLAVMALLESRTISSSTRMHFERIQDELQAELAVLRDDQDKKLSA